MEGLFEKLNIKGMIPKVFRFFKAPLPIAWAVFTFLVFTVFISSLFVSYTPPVSQSVTISFHKPQSTVKVGLQHEAPAQDPAYKKYAQPYTVAPGAAVAAIVITDLGLDADNLKLARDLFPKEVTFALSPQTSNLSQVIQDLRSEGREVVMMIPMEPLDYPFSDPGPNALLTSLNPEDNLARLREYLKDTQGIVGVTNYMGDAFVRSVEHIRPFLTYLKSQGYLIMDTTYSEKSEILPLVSELQMTPTLVKTQDFEDLSSKKTREAGLSNIERLAKRDMKVVAYSTSYPADMTAISDWSKSLNEKGITLVPLTFAQNYQAIQEPEKPANDPKAH